MVTAYFGLPDSVCKQLEKRVKNTQKNRSHITRTALDAYFLEVNKKPLKVQGAYEKDLAVGLKYIPVTIRRDQDNWLRMMAEKTGKSLSGLGKEAIERYLEYI